MRPDQKMVMCGSCGIQDFEGNTPFSVLQPHQLELYKIRDSNLQNEPNTISYSMMDQSWYHLHPNAQNLPNTSVCSSCKDCIVKKARVPPWSLAAGCDYGQVPEELKSLSTVESMVISQLIFLMAFPHLFTLGKCLPTKGTFSPKYVLHLLLQHDGRFSRDHRLLFRLFNQLQRHRSIAGINSRIKAKNSEREALRAILNDENFSSPGEFSSLTERIDRDPAFRSMLVSMLRFVDAAGSAVPYSLLRQKPIYRDFPE